MDISAQLLQQQATVRMLEKMVRAKRSSPDELLTAQRRLADLQQQSTAPPRVDQPKAEHVPAGVPAQLPVNAPIVPPAIVGDEYARLQADLGKQADGLQRKIADLSNQLHQIPQHVACPDLTRQILDLVAQREAVWDKKRYLERNHVLPPEPVAESPLPTLPGNEEARYELAYQKRRLVDLKSKLRRKMANPKAKPSKRTEWEIELAQCEQKIQEINFKLS